MPFMHSLKDLARKIKPQLMHWIGQKRQRRIQSQGSQLPNQILQHLGHNAVSNLGILVLAGDSFLDFDEDVVEEVLDNAQYLLLGAILIHCVCFNPFKGSLQFEPEFIDSVLAYYFNILVGFSN